MPPRRAVWPTPRRAHAQVRVTIYQHYAFGVGDKPLGFFKFRLRDLSVPAGGLEAQFPQMQLQHGNLMLQLGAAPSPPLVAVCCATACRRVGARRRDFDQRGVHLAADQLDARQRSSASRLR